jgi:O-antigen/teichoic acid export membrane protein
MSKHSLLAKAQSGLMWNGGFRAFHVILQFGVTLILARLLEPEDYGIYAVVSGIIGFLNAASFDNFIGHIVQVRDEKDVHTQDHFTAAVVLEFSIFLVSNMVALGLRYVRGYEDVAPYIHVLSPILLLGCVGGFRYRILERELNWPRYRALQAMGVLLTAATMLILGLSGAGVYALLVAPSMKYFPPIVDLLFVEKWRPTWQWSFENYRPAMRFGFNRMAASALLKGRVMLEGNWLVALLGVTSLGFYNRAFGLMQMICVQFSTVVSQAVYPVLTRVEAGSEQYRRGAALVLRGIAWTVIPAAVLCAMLAAPTITLLFGEKWLPSADLLPLVMASGTIAAISQAAYVLTLANLQETSCLWYDTLRLVGTAISLALWPLFGSIEGYLVGIGIVEFCGLVLLLYWLHRARAVSLRGIALAMLPPLVAGIAGFLSVRFAIGFHPKEALTATPNLATLAMFSSIYLIVLRLAFLGPLNDLVSRLPYANYLRRLLLMRRAVAIG